MDFDVDIKRDDPLRETVRDNGKTGVAKTTVPLSNGLGIDTRVKEVDTSVQQLKPAGPPQTFVDPNGVVFLERVPVLLEDSPLGGVQASGSGGGGVPLSEYGRVVFNIYEDPSAPLGAGGGDATGGRLDRFKASIRNNPVKTALGAFATVAVIVALGTLGGLGYFAGASVARPKSKNLDEDLPDPDTNPVDFGDVLSENGDTTAGDTAQLLDNTGAATTASFTTVDSNNKMCGTWAISNNDITFTLLQQGYTLPTVGGVLTTAQYQLVTTAGVNTYAPGTLTVHYPPTAAPIPAVTAMDRTSSVPIPVVTTTLNAGFSGQVRLVDSMKNNQSMLTDMASGGAWSVDDSTQTVTFTLPQGSAVPSAVGSVTVPYVLVSEPGTPNALSSQSQPLTINFPPPAPVPISSTNTTIDVFQANNLVNFAGSVSLWDQTTGQPVSSATDPATGGTWGVSGHDITFSLTPPPSSSTTVQFEYVLQLNGVNSSPATVQITLSPANPGPPAPVPISSTNTTIDVFQANNLVNFAGSVSLWDQTTGQPVSSATDPATGGTWGVSGHDITFTLTPPPSSPTTVQFEYVLQLNGVNSSPASVQISLSPVNPGLPTPVPISSAKTTIDVFQANSLVNFAGSVSLWDQTTGQPVSSATDPATGGTWGVNGNDITFSLTPLPSSPTTVQFEYVLQLNGANSSPASVQIFLGPLATVKYAYPGTATPVTNPNIDVLTPLGLTSANIMGFQVNGLADATTGGQWGASNDKITFTLTKSIPSSVPSATIQYVLTFPDGSQATGSVEVDFTAPPSPGNLTQTNGSRTGNTYFDLTGLMPGDSVFIYTATTATPPVVTLQSSYTDSSGTWTAGVTDTATNQIAIEFAPGTATAASDSVQYVIVRNELQSAPATVSLTFSNVMMAMANMAVTMDATATLTHDISSTSVTPNGLASVQLYTDDKPATAPSSSLTVKGWTFTVNPSANPPVVTSQLAAGDKSAEIYYAVTDKKGVQSNRARLTAAHLPPIAQHFVLAQAVGGGNTVAANVLADSLSAFARNPARVALGPPIDIGRHNAASLSYVSEDGKTVNVPGEGTHVVDDHGLVVFKAEAGFDDAPTPVTFHFYDTAGNKSTDGIVLIDPALADVTPLLKKLALQSDDDFWTDFIAAATGQAQVLLNDEMLAVTQFFMWATVVYVPDWCKRPEVSDAAFTKAYKHWGALGNGNDDVCKICRKLAEDATAANPKPPLVARYWGLTLIAEMVLKLMGH